VRLVKGAYWDGEIQRAQQMSLPQFPVYTRKSATDVSYLACARRLLQPPKACFRPLPPITRSPWPRCCSGRAAAAFEFQRLHGMGAGLYEDLIRDSDVRCRIYAPVGGYAELLPYLVRRILENSANAGFVYQLASPSISDESLLLDPVTTATRTGVGK
jgi:RHH-type proline utilization regulon transcriptional repressor/proline dehydrogenase/delta 1-pyrroline-5-carboxylate dehydrogenase